MQINLSLKKTKQKPQTKQNVKPPKKQQKTPPRNNQVFEA